MNKISMMVGCIALFSACGKNSGEVRQVLSPVQAQLGNAKHFDIPIPLAFTLAHSSSKKQPVGLGDFMQYTGALAVPEAIAFYKREMERAGWDINDLSSTQEGFLYCTKPTKQCGIEIRQTGKPQKDHATAVCLFVTQKA